MNKAPIIGPIRDLKGLIEALPIVRNLSKERPILAISKEMGLWKDLLRTDPNIGGVLVSDSKEYDLDLHRSDPFDVISSLRAIYVYPWIYLTERERALACERIQAVNGPRVVMLKDGLSEGRIFEIKEHIRRSLHITPEVFSFKPVSSPRQTLLNLATADTCICASVQEALLIPATGTPTVVITDSPEDAITLFRAFFPPEQAKLEEEFTPIVRFCSPDMDNLIRVLKELVPQKKAIFFDRDGTLCEDVNYLSKIDDLKIFPDVEKLKELKDMGTLLIGITNQSGIERGLVSADFNKMVNKIFMDKYGFDDFYSCPHLPQKHCACRKPSPAMTFKARANHGVALRESVVVGDKDSDMLLARAIGAKAVLITTGQQKYSPYAHRVINSLSELSTAINPTCNFHP